MFGVGILPIGGKVELFAKAGYAVVDLDATVSDPLIGTVSGLTGENELAYGAGLSFKIGTKVAVRAEYEAFSTTESIDMISMGPVFGF